MTRRRAPRLAPLALVLALACNGEEPKLPTAPPERAPTEAPAEPTEPAVPEPAPGVSATPRPDGTVVASVRGADGRSFDAEFGGESELPSGFPDDVPLYGAAKPMSSMASVEHGTIVNLRTSDPADRVHAWYLERLEAQGWEIEHARAERGRHLIAARKGNRVSSVVVTGVPEFTQVMVTVAEDR